MPKYVLFIAALLAARWLLGPVAAHIVLAPRIYLTEWQLRRRGLRVGRAALGATLSEAERYIVVTESDAASRKCLQDGRGLAIGIVSGILTAGTFPSGPGWLLLLPPLLLSMYGASDRIMPGMLCLGSELLAWKLLA